ncbi:glutathione S-transferase family protein [Microbaculum marinisediminis]|uniref:Glutathione S-transferase family protein n=1 Tax=Microbaculum marinisediminis TaxID=2931392 RepID=A0AAW5R292_9HYPH|nr:glutathione S-transferase family protein [Microbaculum sp. A6E488]MCT8972665.1 glutathione S-transferase family protein [Microbaculum sp. A6E488]
MLTLVIGNKNYSSWSLRPWLAMRHFEIPFEEVLIPLDQPDTKTRILAQSPGGKVPVLKDGDLTIWDSLAILEYLAERFPEKRLWPERPAARALARSIACEMHSGFTAIRSACPMNLRKRFAYRDRGADVTRDAVRIQQVWADCRRRYRDEGPFLFGAFGAVDAMFAPVVTRFETYAIPVDDEVGAYMNAVLSLPAFLEWKDAGVQESWVLDHDEVDEPAITAA